MSDKNFAFANIVSTPTTDSWSQAYHAGKLFAVLSLKKNVSEENTEEETLGSSGKSFFTCLEQEFFTLEEKDLDSIKSAIEVSLRKIPDNVSCSLAVGSIIEDIFYVFCFNKARIDFKRENAVGALLQGDESLKFASGRLRDGDIAVLQTEQFNELVNAHKLYSFLENQSPSEISEGIAPLIHDKEEGGAAAIIIKYKRAEEEFYAVENFSPIKQEKKESEVETKTDEPLTAEPIDETREKNILSISTFIKKIKLPKIKKVNSPRKMILIVIIVIAVVFSGGIYLNIQRQNNAKIKALFEDVYARAQSKYEEGQSLTELNQNLAYDSFSAAKKIIDGSTGKFPKGSDEEKKILELSERINKSLGSTSGINSSSAKVVEQDQSILLSFENKNNGTYVYQTDKNLFSLDSSGVNMADLEGKNSKKIIKNEDSWKEAGGLASYLGNVYVLDKKDGILKYIQSGDKYEKSSYFPRDTSPDLSRGSAIAVDGSIWILFSDGNIAKFTKGVSDNLKVSGVDMPFKNPNRIWTSVDSERVYILDKGNARVVVLDKNGGYKEQYQSSAIKTALDFDIKEEDKKILFLSSGKIYEIKLK